MKLKPIFEWCFKYTDLPVNMRIGYRYDELEREQTFKDAYKFPYKCEYQEKSNRWIQRWKELDWRVGEFPLIKEKIMHKHIVDYWSEQSIVFPEDSNCQNCFWKDPQQLRKNFDTNPAIMKWAGVQEVIRKRTFKKEMDMFSVAKIGLQMDFMFGTGSGCQAGFCTD